MPESTLQTLTERLELCDRLLFGRSSMYAPQDLPGRYGRVIAALDRILVAMQCESVVAGGWAVWFHGFEGRMTQDVDIVLPANRIDEFLRIAQVAGFDSLPTIPGRWPKLDHKETGIKVDILPEGARPGTVSRPAPTTIPHPSRLGASGASLQYINLPHLIELKLAAARAQDVADIVKLIQCNASQVESIQRHLLSVHVDYGTEFLRLIEQANDQQVG